MIRGLVLLALMPLAFCGYSYWYWDGIYAPENWNERLYHQVDCASYCTLEGSYSFMRDWIEYEEDFVERTDIFNWDIDAPPGDFWEDDCADEVWWLKYGGAGMNEEECNRCRPEWVYSYVNGFNYDRHHGRVGTGMGIKHAYHISESRWEDWCEIAVSSRNRGNYNMYDKHDGLLLAYPMGEVSDLTTRFEGDHQFGVAMIGNYEPNYCTAAIPFAPQSQQTRCNTHYNFDSENPEYPTYEYCDTWGWENEYLQAEYACVPGDSDCDSIEFEDRRSNRKMGSRLLDARTPMPAFKKKNTAQFEGRAQRGYNPTVTFQDQNFIASVAEPYCARKVDYSYNDILDLIDSPF